MSSAVDAVCHKGALQLHGPRMEQERSTSDSGVSDKKRKCVRANGTEKVVGWTKKLDNLNKDKGME